ncbi:MAG TPA: hypothetical protein EYQ14_27720 [Gammaproteobacteria bacterium]|nr:hypothetical protein [Gammaproteobacteria bacterium]HIL98705.1 hypothetical protein [Pseudomonadales bacterium]
MEVEPKCYSGLLSVFWARRRKSMSEQAEATATGPLPVVDWLKLPEGGDPYLEGQKCGSCDAIFLGERDVCAKCGTRGQLKATKLSNKGKLYVYSIVYRSFPGIDVPYVSAIVDLDGGGTVKGNLIGIDPDPEKIKFDMAVDVVYQDALGRKDSDGNSYISYFFKPAA